MSPESSKAEQIQISSFRSIASREWLVALLVSIILAVVLAVPYILGYVLSGDEIAFTGLIMNPEDSNSYFAKMLQGFDGHWLYKIPFTTEEHDPAFLGGFYLLIGHLARISGQSLDIMWHMSRALSSITLFMVTFAFISAFLSEKRQRWTAYLLAILGSGLGWLLFVFGQSMWLGAFPVDFKMPEAHLFFTALTFPHVALGTSLLMISFYFLLLTLQSRVRVWTYVATAALSVLALGIVYPFLIYLVVLAIGIYYAYLAVSARKVLWREAGLLVIPLAVAAPLYVYYAYTYQINDVYQSWAAQAITVSPPLPHYLVAYGPLLILAILPLLKRQQGRPVRRSSVFMWIWTISAALLLYAPINPQRRFVQGLQVPLTILATVGLFEIALPWLRQTRIFSRAAARPRYSADGLEKLILMALISLAAISNLYVLGSVSVTTAIQQPYPFFRDVEEIEAVKWLRENGEIERIVFSGYETGNYIASHAGNPVWLGHWAETVDWSNKYDLADQFYSNGRDDVWRRQLLDRNEVSYVWYGELERLLGDFEPAHADYLVPIYQVGDVTIFIFRPS